MIDAIQLHKAYELRVKSLEAHLDSNTNKLIQEKVTHAIYSIHLAMKTFLDLATNVKRFTPILQSLSESIQPNSQDVIRLLQTMEENASIIGDFKSRDDAFNLLIGIVDTQKTKAELSTCLLLSTSYIFENNIRSLVNTLSCILNNKQIDNISNAFNQLFSFLVGLSPIGAFASAVQSVQSIFTNRKKKVLNASDYLDELDEYIYYAHSWTMCAQLTISLLDYWDNPDDSILELSAQRIKERFGELLNT